MGMPRYIKAIMILVLDTMLIFAAYYFALVLRLSAAFPIDTYVKFLDLIFLIILIGWVLLYVMRLHMIKLSAFDSSAQIRSAIWILLLTIIATFSNAVFSLGAPRTVPIIAGFVMFIFVIGSRLIILKSLLFIEKYKYKNERVAVAIYGAGMGGRQLVSSLNNSLQYNPAFLVDDNKSFHGTIIGGLNVIGPEYLEKNIKSHNVQKIFLAIPSVTKERKKTILASLKKFDCEVKELPSYIEIIESGDVLNSLRSVDTEDLLGREKVEVNLPQIVEAYANQNVFVSGAGGSIGSQLCRQVCEIGPKKIILYELSEYALYTIEMELRPIAQQKGFELIPILGSVLDQSKINALFKEHKLDIVLHAAAYKHVPLIETNEIEAGRNNILGTKILAEASIANNVKRFTLISTDKAVRPTNVMGATKRFAELVIQGLSNEKSKTIFSIVRFGNVLGSSGSVIPLFKEQIANGGPITLTNSKMTRYFMTIPEAAKLVLIAGSFAEGGEVFVLDMGKPVQIKELAKKMITLSGLTIKDDKNPDGDIAIEVIGLRSGEKLHEELFIGGDILTTPHSKIMRVRENSLSRTKIQSAIKEANKWFSTNNALKFREFLAKYVEGYGKDSKD